MRMTNPGRTKVVLVLALFAMSAILLGVAVAPLHAQTLYGVDMDSRNLYKVSTANAALTLVGNTGQTLGSLEYRPSNGMLYGFTVGTGAQLYRINPANAATTLVGPLDPANNTFYFEGALVIAPDGTAYATNKDGAANAG